MADNSNNKKKTLIIGVLAFLLTGGGVFLFFVIQGSNDLTGANRKNAFTYGGAAREATASFFKFIGFDDVEDIAKEGPKDRLRLKEYAAAGILDDGGLASGAEEDIPWAPPAASGRSAAPSNIPRMGGGGTSGVGGMGGGGTKSSGGASRFGDASGAGNTKISNSVQEAGTGVKGKDSLAALAKTRALLGDGLRSGSAAAAKGKWDSSFGVGRSAGGGGNDLAYGKTGLVNLDKIKKGEVDNLKTTDPKSLKVPEVGAPVKDEKAAAQDSAVQKAKEAAEDAIAKSMASSMLGGLGQGLSNAGGSGGQSSPDSRSGAPEGNTSGSCSNGVTTGVCSAAASAQIPSDTKVSYNKVGSNANGDVFEVTYEGAGKGITPDLKGTPVNYRDTAIVQITKDGPKILSMGAINEVPVAAP
jgi:hypothetical protein